MFFPALHRLIRRRCQHAVAVAIMPLIILNGLSVAEGCICADGHYESICRASLCEARTSDCGHPCGAKCSCCTGRSCCSRPHVCHPSPQSTGDEVTLAKRCCTRLVHQVVPTVVDASHVRAWQHAPICNAAVLEPSYSLCVVTTHTAHRAELGTGPPPCDLVVTLQRLVI
jgi:hypothetical protein